MNSKNGATFIISNALAAQDTSRIAFGVLQQKLGQTEEVVQLASYFTE